MADIEIRYARAGDAGEWMRAFYTGFLLPVPPADGLAEVWGRRLDPDRVIGAWDGERCVATLEGMSLAMTVPGGALLPAAGITAVTTTSTHRRRGLLTGMMALGLGQARERGESVAILIATEHRIYGHFGFGHATRRAGWEIDVPRSGGLRPGLGDLAPGARIELVDMAEVRVVGPALHERILATRPGLVRRPPVYWQLATGEEVWPGEPFTVPFAAVHRDPAGSVSGLMTYRVDRSRTGGDPDGTLTVGDHLALDPVADAALWRHALTADLVRHVAVPSIAPDHPLPLWLANPRAATSTADQAWDLWLRVLDAPRVFAARRYDVPGRTVLDVRDPQGYVAGRWLLETFADGTGELTATAGEPELALDADALAAVYLGGVTVPQLAAAGLVRELRPGAAARAGLQLRSALAPWCPDVF